MKCAPLTLSLVFSCSSHSSSPRCHLTIWRYSGQQREEWWCLYILILCCYGSTYQHIDICLLHRTQSNNHEYLSGCLCLHKSVRERKTSTNITHTAESWEWVREASGAAYIRMVKWKETRDKDEIKVKKKKGKEESRRRTTVGRGKPMLSATLASSSGVTRGEEEEKHRKRRQMMRYKRKALPLDWQAMSVWNGWFIAVADDDVCARERNKSPSN